MSDLVEPVSDSLKRFQPQFEYFLLDEGRLSPEVTSVLPNLVSALIELENSQSPRAIMDVLEHLTRWLKQDNPEHRRLRRTFTVWLCNILLPKRFEGEEFSEIEDILEVKTMLSETVDEWTKKWKEEGMAEGLEEGIAKGLEQGIAKGLEQGLEKGLEQGLEQGRNLERLESAQKMLAEGFADDVVARITDLSLSEIESLKSEH